MPKFLGVKSAEDILVWGVRICIALILFTPLIVSKNLPFPVVFPKALYFQSLVEMASLFYALLLIQNFKKYLPKFSPILIAVFIFTEVLMFAALRGVNFERSLWGTIERGEGLILHLHLFAFFLVLTGVFRKFSDWLNVLRLTLLVSFPVGLGAIIQKAGIAAIYTDLSSGRVAATFGNPVFYGSYLVLVILFAIVMGILEKNPKWRMAAWGLLVFNGILLVMTGTRGAWLGIISGLILFAILWFFFFGQRVKEWRQTFLFGVFALSLFFLLFLVFSDLGYLPKNYITERYESAWFYVVNGKDARSFVWQLGLDAWKASPLLGYGPESYNYIYDKLYQAKFMEIFPGSTVEIIPESIFFDRAHNKLIDTLESSGIAGLLSYLAIFGAAIVMLFKGRIKQINPMLPYAFLSVFVGYFVQNIFTFDIVGTYLVFFILLAFVDVSSRAESEPPVSGRLSMLELAKEFKIAGGAAAVIIAAIIFFTVNVRTYSAYADLVNFNFLSAKGQTKEALESFNSALLGPGHTKFEVNYYGIQTLLRSMEAAEVQGVGNEAAELLEQQAAFTFEHLRNKKEVLHMRALMLVAGTYKSLYIAKNNPAYLEREEEVLGDAIKMNPQLPKVYRMVAEMRILQNRLDEAQVFLMKGYELDHDWGKFYEWLGMSFLEAGEKESGAKYLRMGLNAGNFYHIQRFNMDTVWQVAKAYEDSGDWKGLADFYEEVIERYPKTVGLPHPQLFASLSTVYARIGEREKARDATERMLKIYPNLRTQAESFLKNLEQENQ